VMIQPLSGLPSKDLLAGFPKLWVLIGPTIALGASYIGKKSIDLLFEHIKAKFPPRSLEAGPLLYGADNRPMKVRRR